MKPPWTWFALLLSLAGFGLAGCVSPREDLGRVSADLEQRTGHTVTNAKPGTVSMPAGVLMEDGLSEDEAVTLALWNNALFQETLADLGLSRADLVQAGVLPHGSGFMSIFSRASLGTMKPPAPGPPSALARNSAWSLSEPRSSAASLNLA